MYCPQLITSQYSAYIFSTTSLIAFMAQQDTHAQCIRPHVIIELAFMLGKEKISNTDIL